jgi:hypothetical protein
MRDFVYMVDWLVVNPHELRFYGLAWSGLAWSGLVSRALDTLDYSSHELRVMEHYE